MLSVIITVIFTNPSLPKYFDVVSFFCFYSARSVLREDINKLHRQLLDERSRADKIKQDLVCLKFFCQIYIFFFFFFLLSIYITIDLMYVFQVRRD